MATVAAPTVPTGDPSQATGERLLEPGDRLSRDEFEWRYDQMPGLNKAELVEGIVYMPSPLRARKHAHPQSRLGLWLATYELETPGVQCFDNATVRLDLDNEPQPDLMLIKTAEKGGQARISSDDYVEGAPELVLEIVGSSRAYDLHQKKEAYRRNGVREYLAWITTEDKLIWWELRQGQYAELSRSADGILKSNAFPGLWLDTAALLRGDMKAVLARLREGLSSPEHGVFVR
jgi:Uma2 family endonuclease